MQPPSILSDRQKANLVCGFVALFLIKASPSMLTAMGMASLVFDWRPLLNGVLLLCCVWLLVDVVTFCLGAFLATWSWEKRLRRKLERMQRHNFLSQRETLPFNRN
jgi:uncharacterized protein (DUF2062 family)